MVVPFLLRSAVVVCALVFLNGCASPDDNPFRDRQLSQPTSESGLNGLSSGVFLDSRVGNLIYRRDSGESGRTNQWGEFEYSPGERVSFHIGNIRLGEALGASIITPLDLYNNDRPIDAAALVRRLRFLQAMDMRDPNSSDPTQDAWDGIALEESLHIAASQSSVAYDALDSGNVNDLMLVLGAPRSISAEQARQHFDSTRRALLTGNYALDINVANSPDVLHLEFAIDAQGVIKGWAETQLRVNESLQSQNVQLLSISGNADIDGTAEFSIDAKAYTVKLQIDYDGSVKGIVGQSNDAGHVTLAGKYDYHFFQTEDAVYAAEYTGERVRVYQSIDQSWTDFKITFSRAATLSAEETFAGDYSSSNLQLDKLGNAALIRNGDVSRFLIRQPYQYAGVYQAGGWEITVDQFGLSTAVQIDGTGSLPVGRVYGNGQFEVRRSDFFSTVACGVPMKIKGQLDVFSTVITFEQEDAPTCMP